jgi:hydroxymethylpyrimidine pyrophosphatase-like HAD family hydrolase
MNFISGDGKIIAVDFDGTIVENNYPKIGKEMKFAFTVIAALQGKGHRLILWTVREGKLLADAVDYCKKNGVAFYAINENYEGERQKETYSRKLNADLFIDDRNIGGFIGWPEVWQMLYPNGDDFEHQLKNPAAHHNIKPKKPFWRL